MGLLYTQALADRATAYLALPLNDKRSPAGLLELATIWATINKLPPVDCRQCQYSERQADVAAYIRNFSRFQNPAAMSDSQYQFAPAYQNESISDERYAKKVTADNLTDEDAEFLINKGYGHVIISRKAAETVAAEPAVDTDAKPADTKATDGLKAEKKAHGETKKELAEVKKQLAEAQKQLADLADKAKDAATDATAEADATK